MGVSSEVDVSDVRALLRAMEPLLASVKDVDLRSEREGSVRRRCGCERRGCGGALRADQAE